MFAGVAEFERALIRHRTNEGRQAAKRRGVWFGRPQKLRPDQKALALSLVREGESISEVARTFNVHPATIHRCLNEPRAAKFVFAKFVLWQYTIPLRRMSHN